MADAPIFYLLAGPNGAGKSTLYKNLTQDGLIDAQAEFVNADLYEAAHLQHIPDLATRSLAARNWADDRRAQLLASKQSFVSETVFSHSSKLTLLDDAKRCGFYVMLFIVGLDDPRQLLQRVKQRVLEGGHSVPDERILARYPRTMAHLKLAIPKAHVALIYDTNELAHVGHDLVAACQDGRVAQQAKTVPQWAKTVLGLAG
jgi:predicted ABC-type ATPase